MNLNPFARLFAGKPTATGKPVLRTLGSEIAIDQNAAANALARAQDPDEALKQNGINRAQLRVLEFDDEINAALETRRLALLATPWRIEPAEGSGRAGRKAADAVWQNLEDILPDAMRVFIDAVFYGYSVAEIIYAQNDDGSIRIDRITGKPMEWFSPQSTGVLIYTPTAGAPFAVDTAQKFILTRSGASYRNPYGDALLSRLYYVWFLRREAWAMWARYLERHGAPLLVGKIDLPPMDRPLTEAEQDDLQAAINALSASLNSAVRSATIATTAQVEAIAPQNAGEAFTSFQGELNKRIQKTILGQTLTTDVGKTGSYAAANVHNSVREDRRNADLRLVAQSVQRAINALADINGWPRPVFDWILQSEIESERAKRDATLVQSGITALTEDYLLRVYDYQPGDLATPSGQPAQPAAPAPSFAAHRALTFASATNAPTSFTPGQQVVEDQVGGLVDGSAQAIDPELLMTSIRLAESPADLTQRLSLLMSQRDPAFEDTLAKAQFAAQVLGYLHADERTP